MVLQKLWLQLTENFAHSAPGLRTLHTHAGGGGGNGGVELPPGSTPKNEHSLNKFGTVLGKHYSIRFR